MSYDDLSSFFSDERHVVLITRNRAATSTSSWVAWCTPPPLPWSKQLRGRPWTPMTTVPMTTRMISGTDDHRGGHQGASMGPAIDDQEGTMPGRGRGWNPPPNKGSDAKSPLTLRTHGTFQEREMATSRRIPAEDHRAAPATTSARSYNDIVLQHRERKNSNRFTAPVGELDHLRAVSVRPARVCRSRGDELAPTLPGRRSTGPAFGP